MALVAYHNDPALKAGLIASLKAHAEADEFVKGRYWKNGKGCAVGCTLEFLNQTDHTNHMLYESKLGIPVMLAKLEDRIFEGLPNDKAQQWPIKFSQAIRPGADLSLVGWKFLHWLLTDAGMLDDGGDKDVRAEIKQCADFLVPLTRGDEVDAGAAYAAADAAYATARATYATARAAADATYATYAAAHAAAQAAAHAAACAADATYTADADAAYEKMATKLLNLLRAAQ